MSWRMSRSSQRSPVLDATGLVLSLASGSKVSFDLVVSVKERDILVIEMKRSTVFRASVDAPCENLCYAFSELSLHQNSPDPRCEVLVEAVDQIYTYMTNMNLGYGVISSLDVLYVVRRVVVEPMGDILEISEGITSGSSMFLGAVAYVLSLAFNDVRDFNQLAADAKRSAKESLNTNSGASSGSGRHNLYGGLKETPAEHLNLEAHAFATGWSGNIVRGTYEGQAVAVKIAKIGSVRAKALLTEIRAYDQLRKYWGLLHGDIRCSNFLVDKRVDQGVRLIDFGFSRPITSSDDRTRERAQLEVLLEHAQKLCKLTHKGV